MKYIKLFENYMSTKASIEDWLIVCNIKNYTINDDLSVDVDGDVKINGRNLKEIGVKFNRVKGNFLCSNNLLKSLKNCPIYVGGNFDCRNNSLINLKDSPREIGGHFIVKRNLIETLIGCTTEKVGGGFDCAYNNLENLEGSPTSIGGSYVCGNNAMISLKGAPDEIFGHFVFMFTVVSSLEYLPSEIGGTLECSYNRLTALDTSSNIEGDIACSGNQSIEGDTIDPKNNGFMGYCGGKIVYNSNLLSDEDIINNDEDYWDEEFRMIMQNANNLYENLNGSLQNEKNY